MEASLLVERTGTLPSSHWSGQDGVEKILKMTVALHVEKVKQEDELVADTTVQEAKVNFPIIRVQVGELAQ